MEEIYLTVSEESDVIIVIDEHSFNLHFYPFRGLMYLDLSKDGEIVASGQRVIANQWLLPLYMMDECGNFRFETYKPDANQYVWWEGYNQMFRLVSYTKTEIEEMG